jgi:aminoglycoside/choline kinase family phosphotransferase
MSRNVAKMTFLAANGFGAAEHQPLPVDCSYRSYVRLCGGPSPTLLMDSPPGLEPLKPFVDVAAHLEGLGFSVPHVSAADIDGGFALIEDFGEATFTRRLDAGADPVALYTLAIDTLVALQQAPGATAIAVAPYDMTKLLSEAALFLDWYWPAARGDDPSDQARESYNAILRDALAPIVEAPHVLVLRDFHVDNLMTLANREGIAACGLLDFQDALLGHPAYDLVSLLQDARLDVAPDLVATVLARYAAAAPELVDMSAYWILGAQRHLKVYGIFARQSRRDGKHHYLGHIERLWRLLAHCVAAEPRLAPLGEWLAEYWPPATRIVPPVPEAPS